MNSSISAGSGGRGAEREGGRAHGDLLARPRRAGGLRARALPLPRRHRLPARASCSPAPFPVGILALPLALTFIRLGLYDSAARRRTDAHRARPALRGAGTRKPLPASRASSRRPPGCSAARAPAPSAASSCRSPCPESPRPRSLPSCISWNEVFAAAVLTLRHRTLTAYPAHRAVGNAAPHAVRRRVPADRALGRVHLPGAALPVRDVGSSRRMRPG